MNPVPVIRAFFSGLNHIVVPVILWLITLTQFLVVIVGGTPTGSQCSLLLVFVFVLYMFYQGFPGWRNSVLTILWAFIVYHFLVLIFTPLPSVFSVLILLITAGLLGTVHIVFEPAQKDKK